MLNIHFIDTKNTILQCIYLIQHNKRGVYLRFGDGDFNIVRNMPDMLCNPSINFIKWMKIAMSLRGSTVMTCLPHHCAKLNTIEEGIIPGNHEYDFKSIMIFLELLQDQAVLPESIYSNIALSYCSSHNPDIVIDLHNLLKQKTIVFFGNQSYSDEFLKLLFCDIIRIDTKERDSYLDHDLKIKEFDILYNTTLSQLEYFVIIMAAGCGGRAYSAEIYTKYSSNFFILDYGSLIDYLSGKNTRAYMNIDPPKKDYILQKLH